VIDVPNCTFKISAEAQSIFIKFILTNINMRLRPLKRGSIAACSVQHRSALLPSQRVLQRADGIALLQCKPRGPQEGSD
jgi:hypothetical protein